MFSSKNSSVPDFAFPKDVIKESSVSLDTSLKSGDYVSVLRQALNLTVARDLISSDSLASNLSMLSDLASKLPSPYSRLALILEAGLYQSCYDSSPWIFNERNLPAEPIPEDVSKWDADIFARHIVGLVREASADLAGLSGVKLDSMASLFTPADNLSCWSVADFIAFNGSALLDVYGRCLNGALLPFDDTFVSASPKEQAKNLSQELLREIYEINLEAGNSKVAVFAARKLLEELPAENYNDFLNESLTRFESTPYAVPLLSIWAARNRSENPKEVYARLQAYISAFSKAEGVAELKNVVKDLLRKQADYSLPSMILPDVSRPLDVTLWNMDKAWLLVYKISNPEKSKSNTLLKNMKPVASIPIEGSSEKVEAIKRVVEIPPLKPGYYTIAASSTPDPKGLLENDSWYDSFNVSAISILSVNEPDGERRIYVVAGSDQHPLPEASVTLQVRNGQYKFVDYSTLALDKNGSAVIPQNILSNSRNSGSVKIIASFKGNKVEDMYYYWGGRTSTRKVVEGSLFTDLGVYRPGAELRYAGVVYSRDGHDLSPAADVNLAIELSSPNGEVIPVGTLVSGHDGRFSGKLMLPASGLLGNFKLRMLEIPDPHAGVKNGHFIASANVRVEEYKMPGFIVSIERGSSDLSPMQEVSFKGSALTYTGMPVGNAKVAYTVEWSRWPWFRGDGGMAASYRGEVFSDPSGNFSISLPTSKLKGTPYEKGVFTIRVEVTDQAGETQSSSPQVFVLGEEVYNVSAEIPAKINLTDVSELILPVSVKDAAGFPVARDVAYRLVNEDGNEVASGKSAPSELRIPSRILPSGRYRLWLSVDSTDAASSKAPYEFIIYRTSDVRPPVETPLWIEEQRVVIRDGKRSCRIRVGSSYSDNWILAVTSNSQKIIMRQWIKVSDGITEFEAPVPTADERVFVEFIGCHDLKVERAVVTILPLCQTERVVVEQRSFRSSIEPGSREDWSFVLHVGDRLLAEAPVMAVLSNKALDVISPFRWYFNPYGSLSWNAASSVSFHNVYDISFREVSDVKYYKNLDRPLYAPEWQTYGYPLSAGMRSFREPLFVGSSMGADSGEGMELRSSRKMVASANMTSSFDMAADKEEAAEEDSVSLRGGAISGDAGSDTNLAEEISGIEMREIDTPSIFFMPDLTTDSDGVVNIGFSMPQALGAWQLQVLAYSPDMKGTVAVYDVVSARKVMARLNAPRFLRTDDRVSIAANLYNNSQDMLPIAGRIELVDPLSDKVVAFEDFPAEEVAPSDSRIVKSEMRIGSKFSMLAIRVYAISGECSDGEQAIVPVLPSSEPVIEARTFFLPPGEREFSYKLPSFAKDADVTLQYCGNPAWEVLSSLPSLIESTSVSTLSNVSALYGNAVAAGLLSTRPELAEGLRAFLSPENSEDSTLVSRLEKNLDLKAVALANTPWLADAAAQTLRMESLSAYLDQESSKKAISSIVDELKKTQLPDGGWSWCPGMESSLFVTGRSLLYFSMLRQLGYMPKELEAAAGKAVGYFDRKVVEDWKKNKKDNPGAAYGADLLYIRSGFDNIPIGKDFKDFRGVILKELRKEWKSLDIYHKAVAAIVLHRAGDEKNALEILNSLSQYASVTEERGMWFDNLRNSWSSFNPLITTTQVLEAFSEISPVAKEVDLLRQSILLSGVTEEWGNQRETVEVVNAILKSGADWLLPSKLPEIIFGGQRVEPAHRAVLTGSFKIGLPMSGHEGSKLEIKKYNSGPSWGGVVARYVAPVKSVKADGDSHLKVEKEIFLLDSENGAGKASSGKLKVGDRVRVTITIRNDRNLDYVAVTDDRAACLEPVDKISGYSVSDGIWMYKEVRDSSTNLFIEYLPQGTHIISYDCYVDREGEYSLGIATAQSQLAPSVSAHSAGKELSVR